MIPLNIKLFSSNGASKTITKTIKDSYNNSYTVTISVNETLVDDYITTNKSLLSGSVVVSNTGNGGAYTSSKDMSATMTFKHTNSSGDTLLTKTGSCKFDFQGDSTKTATPLNFSSAEISHDSDGSLTLYIQIQLKITSTSLKQTQNWTDSITLTTIPRASTLDSFTSTNSVATYGYSKKASSFYDVITFTSNGQTLATVNNPKSSAGTYTGLTASYNMANVLTAATSAGSKTITVTCTIRTYSDSTKATQIGNAQTKTASITLGSDTLSSITLSIANNGTATIVPTISKWNANTYDVLTVSGNNFSQVFNNVSNSNTYTLDNNSLFNAMGVNTSHTLNCTLTTYSSQNGASLGVSAQNNKIISLPTYNISTSVDSYSDLNNNSQPGSMSNPLSYFKPSKQTMIKYLSSPKITFKVSSSTGYLYGRTISTSGAATKTGLIHNSAFDVTPGTNPSNSYQITATDGRKSGAMTQNFIVVPYFVPEVSCDLIRPLPTSTTASVIIKVIYYNDSSSLLTNKKAINNTNNSLVFKYTEEDGSEVTKTYNNFTIINSSSGSTTTMTATCQLTGLNPKKSITYSVVFKDLITYQAKDNGTIPNGQPVISAYRVSGENYVKTNGNMIVDDKMYLYDSANSTYVSLFDNTTLNGQPLKVSSFNNDAGYINQIKTINNQSLVGSGNISISGGSGTVTSVGINAGGGISVSGSPITSSGNMTITNSGVRSIATGSSNGTVSVNTNGTSADVAVKGLGSAAYTASSSYAPMSRGREIINGTQSSSTGSWTGITTQAALYDGMMILYYLPYAGSGNATLNLTLSGGSTTGAKPVYRYGTTYVTTHYVAGSYISLTYNSSKGAWFADGDYNDNTVPSAISWTAAATAAKTASCSSYVLLNNSHLHIIMTATNTSASALTLNVNSKGAKPIYINGTASSSSNYTLPAGSYLVYYDGNNYYFRTDGKLTTSITGNAATVNSHTVNKDVPSNAVFTDTNNRKSFYGTCSTAAATAAKEVTLSDTSGWELKAGTIVGVKFSNTNTASSCTLNINGSGAKSIYYSNSVYTGNSWQICGGANYVTYYMYDGTNWVFMNVSNNYINTDAYTSAYCSTGAGTAAKVATCSGYQLLSNSYLHVIITNSNTSASALTLNVNGKGAKPIFINGSASSSSNYTLPAGSYLTFYDGTNYYFRTDGKLTGNITGSAGSVSASNISSGTLAKERLATSGVTSGSYGQSSNTSPGYSGTFSVPYITVDTYGRVTSASTKTVTMPPSSSIGAAFPIGSIYVTSTNSEPTVGGNWTLIDKEFSNTVGTSGYTINSTNCTAVGTFNWARAGHSITLTVNFTNKVQIKDDTLAMFTINLATWGITQLPYAYYGQIYSDLAKCAAFINITTAGVFQTVEMIPDNYISAGRTDNRGTFVFVIPKEYMVDSACDKFYWKRES